MLRWPSVADKFTPMLEGVMLKNEQESIAINKKRTTALELLAGVQPLVFFRQEPGATLSLENVLKFAVPGSALWEQIAVSLNTINNQYLSFYSF